MRSLPPTQISDFDRATDSVRRPPNHSLQNVRIVSSEISTIPCNNAKAYDRKLQTALDNDGISKTFANWFNMQRNENSVRHLR